MKTNTKHVRDLIRQHILDCVYDYEGNEFPGISQASAHLYEEFERVANYPNNINRLPNSQNRFSDYLCGLPFSFHYTHYDIKEYVNSLGVNPENKEYSNAQSMKLYHYLIYAEMMNNK